jgi:hypothetical protein
MELPTNRGPVVEMVDVVWRVPVIKAFCVLRKEVVREDVKLPATELRLLPAYTMLDATIS